MAAISLAELQKQLAQAVYTPLTDEQIKMIDTLQKVDIGLLVSVPDYEQRKRYLEWYKMKLLEQLA